MIVVAATTLFGYTGRPFDAETGLQNNHHRWYDAGAGRWISKDPIGLAAGDANLSRYAGNSPVNATDPSGLFVEGDSPPWGGPRGSVDDTPDDLPPIIVELPRPGYPFPSSPIPGLPAPTGEPLPRGTPPIYRPIGKHTQVLIDPGDDPDAPKVIVTPEEPPSFDLALDGLFCIAGVGLAGRAGRLGSRATLREAEIAAREFLGENYRVIINRAGDRIFVSHDGLRKIRFDILNSHGDLPHIHVEVLNKGKWCDAIPGRHRLYPKSN